MKKIKIITIIIAAFFIIMPKVNTKVDMLLRKFILSGGFDIDLAESKYNIL